MTKTSLSMALILHRNGRNNFEMYACRGDGKGCDRNKYRKTLAPCDDCIGPLDPKMTLGEIEEKLTKGDA